MINAIDKVFSVHRRFILKIALKIDDREKNENFIDANEANETNETNEKKVNKTIVIDEAIKEKEEKK